MAPLFFSLSVYNAAYMKPKIPKIKILYNGLIDPIFIFYCQNNPELKKRGWNDWVPPSKEEILRRIKAYKEEWEKYEEKILTAMTEILSLEFINQVIDVNIVSGLSRAMSNPIIIKSGFSPSEFVDVLAHELIHKLFQDNVDIYPWKILQEMFPNEKDKTVLNHIITNAVLMYIFVDILKDQSRLDINLESSKNADSDSYAKAWGIVKERGHINLIKELKRKIEENKKLPL